MTNLAQRDERLQGLIVATTKARAKRDDALSALVKTQARLVWAEKQEERFRKSTKRLKAQARKLPVTPPKPEPEPEPEPEPTPDDPATKAARMRAELQDEHKAKRKRH